MEGMCFLSNFGGDGEEVCLSGRRALIDFAPDLPKKRFRVRMGSDFPSLLHRELSERPGGPLLWGPGILEPSGLVLENEGHDHVGVSFLICGYLEGFGRDFRAGQKF